MLESHPVQTRALRYLAMYTCNMILGRHEGEKGQRGEKPGEFYCRTNLAKEN